MSDPQNHYKKPGEEYPLCGKPHPRWLCCISTDVPSDVTCKRCLKRLRVDETPTGGAE